MLQRLHSPLLFTLLLAALALRGLVPLGYMPGVQDGHLSIVLCTPQGYKTVAVDEGAAPAAHTHQECPYAFALGMAGTAPSSSAAPSTAADATPLLPSGAVRILAPAHLTPPARGPPSSSRIA